MNRLQVLTVLFVSSFLFGVKKDVESVLFPDYVTKDMEYITFVNTEYSGQLGNQCFRIATAAGYCVENGYFLAITPRIKNMYPEIFHKIPVITPKSKVKKEVYFGQIFENHPTINGSIRICGYPNSTKYFENHNKLVRDLFKPKLSTVKRLKEKFKYAFDAPEKHVALHLRTFVTSHDYTIPLRIKHNYARWAISPSYYAAAIDQFSKDVTFIVCTDCVSAAKEMFSIYDRKFIFTDNSLEEDFYLLSLMDNVIVCNSSFSMFAAYLNDKPSQKVVMPKYCNQLEIADERWIRIDYDNNEVHIGKEYDYWCEICKNHVLKSGFVK